MASEQVLGQILQGMGIPAGAFQDLIHQAIVGSWTSEQLIAEIYASDAFHQMFPNIFRPDGSLIMSPGRYRVASDTYKHIFDQFGFANIGRDVLGSIIGGLKSPQELADELAGIQRINESPTMYAAFLQTLKANGEKIVGDGKRQLLDFEMGMAPDHWANIFEETSLVSAARNAGVGLSHGQAQQLMERASGRFTEDTASAGFKDLALQHLKTQPLSKLYGMGITKSELLQYEFGGPHQAQVATKIEQVLATDEAFYGQRASTQLVPTQTGGTSILGGSKQERAQVA